MGVEEAVQVAATRRISVAAGIGEEGDQGAQAIDLRGVDQAAPLPGRRYQPGLVERAVTQLEKAGHIYLQDGARWFRSTAFGDEKDRVVQRENGLYTYFASDIAYHLNKYERGFDRMIDIWGADHHGYIPRVKGAIAALGLPPEKLEVALVQFAVLYRDGQKTSMSTRSGEFVTLRELRREVGNDACRFFYVLRKSDQHLDFDLDLAKSQSNENPVYYIQYAHARIASVLASWGGDVRDLTDAELGRLEHPQELAVLNRLAEFPEACATAARDTGSSRWASATACTTGQTNCPADSNSAWRWPAPS